MNTIDAVAGMLAAMPEDARLRVLDYTRELFTTGCSGTRIRSSHRHRCSAIWQNPGPKSPEVKALTWRRRWKILGTGTASNEQQRVL